MISYLFGGLEEALNKSVIEQLVLKTTKLQELEISKLDAYWGKIGEAGKESMADLIAQILARSTCLIQLEIHENKFS